MYTFIAITSLVILPLIGLFFLFKPSKPANESPKPAKIRPPKDPMDCTLTSGSAKWGSDIFCPQCKATISVDERLAGICNECGYSAESIFTWKRRAYRQIWDGAKWVWQYKYSNEPEGQVILDSAIHSSKDKPMKTITLTEEEADEVILAILGKQKTLRDESFLSIPGNQARLDALESAMKKIDPEQEAL